MTSAVLVFRTYSHLKGSYFKKNSLLIFLLWKDNFWTWLISILERFQFFKQRKCFVALRAFTEMSVLFKAVYNLTLKMKYLRRVTEDKDRNISSLSLRFLLLHLSELLILLPLGNVHLSPQMSNKPHQRNNYSLYLKTLGFFAFFLPLFVSFISLYIILKCFYRNMRYFLLLFSQMLLKQMLNNTHYKEESPNGCDYVDGYKSLSWKWTRSLANSFIRQRCYNIYFIL